MAHRAEGCVPKGGEEAIFPWGRCRCGAQRPVYVKERIREGRRTSPSERSTVQGLVVHGRIIGEDVAVRVIVVPAGAMRAEKGEWLRRWG